RRHIRVRYAGGAALRRLSAARVVAARASGPCRGRGAGVAHPRLPCPSARAYAAGVPGVAARDRRQSMPVPRREVTKTAAPLPAVVGVAGAGGVPGGVPGGRRLGQRRRPEAPGGARGALAAPARGVSPEAPRMPPIRGDVQDHGNECERAEDAREARHRSAQVHVDGGSGMSDLDPSLEPWLEALRTEPAVRPEAIARLNAALRAED